MRFRLALISLCLVRCQSCLPPLLPDDTAFTALPVPGVSGDANDLDEPQPIGPTSPTGLPVVTGPACVNDGDCMSGHCCTDHCEECCQTSDCTGSLVCVAGHCTTC